MNRAEVIRLLKKPVLWVTVIICSAAVWLLAFFWASQTPLKYTFRVWIGCEEGIDSELGKEIASICEENGMRKCAINAYNPADFYYPAAFALQNNNVDIYLLDGSEAVDAAQAGIFVTLKDGYKDVLEYEGEVIGVRAGEDKYVLINRASNKSEALLYSVVNAIISHGN